MSKSNVCARLAWAAAVELVQSHGRLSQFPSSQPHESAAIYTESHYSSTCCRNMATTKDRESQPPTIATTGAATTGATIVAETSFDAIAEYYAQHGNRVTIPHALDMIGLAQDQIRQAQTILELGCGAGAFGLAYQQFFPQGIAGQTIICTDLSPVMVQYAERAMEKNPSGTSQTKFLFQVADATDLHDFGDESVDMVVSAFGIFLIPDQSATLREVRRVLRDGGALATTSWTTTHYNHELKVAGFGSNLQEAWKFAFSPGPPPVKQPSETANGNASAITVDWKDPDSIRSVLLEHHNFASVTIGRAIHSIVYPTVEHLWTAMTSSNPQGAKYANDLNAKERLCQFVATPHGQNLESPVFVFFASNLVLLS
jgi:ubiquinone/menaquinone biosynthesis C-methylase UbiE